MVTSDNPEILGLPGSSRVSGSGRRKGTDMDSTGQNTQIT